MSRPGFRGLRSPLPTFFIFALGFVILAIHLAVAVTGPFWAPYGYSKMGAGPPLSGMSLAHPFGTDESGRDVLSRVLYGARVSLSVGFVAVTIYITIGTILTLAASTIRPS